MDQHLIEAISDGVAKLTFNRPERLNALSTPIMEGLLEALPRLARDPTIGVIVLTGAGRAFCAGGDVKSMAEGSAERSVEQAVIHLRGRMEVSRLGPRVALARMKQNFNAAENGTFAELLDLEARNQIETGRTDDHKEAARAFVEKRPPVFTGR